MLAHQIDRRQGRYPRGRGGHVFAELGVHLGHHAGERRAQNRALKSGTRDVDARRTLLLVGTPRPAGGFACLGIGHGLVDLVLSHQPGFLQLEEALRLTCRRFGERAHLFGLSARRDQLAFHERELGLAVVVP